MSTARSDIIKMLQSIDLSATDGIEVEGPWAFRDLRGVEAPIYIYQRGTGAKVKIGKAVATIEGALKFEIELDEEYKDVEAASFEVPMRFVVRQKQ